MDHQIDRAGLEGEAAAAELNESELERVAGGTSTNTLNAPAGLPSSWLAMNRIDPSQASALAAATAAMTNAMNAIPGSLQQPANPIVSTAPQPAEDPKLSAQIAAITNAILKP